MNQSPCCPLCGRTLLRVIQSSNSPLNPDQFDAVRAGDWYCETCKGTESKSGYKYFWNRELNQPQQSAEGELAPRPYHADDPRTCPNCGILWLIKWDDVCKAQRAFDLATMVKLPSDMYDLQLRLHHIIRRHASFSEADDEILLDDYAIAQELLKLLQEQGEQKP